MSTRAQIKIQGDQYRIYIYKHSDGYPEGVLPLLKPIVEQFFNERGFEPDYLLAQIMRRFAIEDYKYHLANPKYSVNPLEGAYSFLGWGLDCEEHGDIEYLYEITSKGEILVNGKKYRGDK